MKATLYEKLVAYSKNNYPFHMPGHKFGRASAMVPVNLMTLDATEASGLDNLYCAEGILKEAMENMRSWYGALDTLFLTNGSTAGILASMLAVFKPGDYVLVARNCHHSVQSSLQLTGAIPVYISPEYDGLIATINPDDVAEYIALYPMIKGAILVSPTYEGVVSPIKEIAEILHREDRILIVDEAHGAHFVLGEMYPSSAVVDGADLVVHSLHKTMPALTQSGLLHRCSNRIDQLKLVEALRIVQTSSPSYMMMGQMDYMRQIMQTHPNEINDYYKYLMETRKALRNLAHINLLCYQQDRLDPTKLILDVRECNIDGYTLANELEEQYGLCVEASQPAYVTLMSTIADSEDALKKLVNAVTEIDKKLIKKSVPLVENNHNIIQGNIAMVSPREVLFAEKEWINLEDAAGRIIAGAIMLYPPGIPILGLGERIMPSHMEYIKEQEQYLQGLQKEETEIKVMVIKEIDTDSKA